MVLQLPPPRGLDDPGWNRSGFDGGEQLRCLRGLREKRRQHGVANGRGVGGPARRLDQEPSGLATVEPAHGPRRGQLKGARFGGSEERFQRASVLGGIAFAEKLRGLQTVGQQGGAVGGHDGHPVEEGPQ